MENASINGYVLKYKLGDGGMSEVWYAENSLRKPAAVKVLLKKFCDEHEIVARFENEAKLMVQLNHPHIRNILDYGIIEERPCMVMEYLEGLDISKRIKKGEKFSNAQLINWWNDLVDALQYTHRKHIIHRDIKPSNLFITEGGKIKLLDFGVAKIKDNITVTQTGSRMGTLMYMSPEQVYDVKNLTYKTDVYSLAVTFYHIITGSAPYDNTKISDFEIQENIVRKDIDTALLPEPWRSLLPGYFYKNAEERRELHKIDEEANYTGATIIEPLLQPQISDPVAFQKNPVPEPAYHYRHQRRKGPSLLILLPIAIILSLIAVALNKDRIANYFDRQNAKEKQVTDKPVRKNIVKPEPVKKPVPTENDTPAGNADTMITKGEDGSIDQVTVSGDTSQKENEMKGIINDYYRSRSDCSSLSRFFNEVVKQYYNKSNVSISTIKKECATYHNKWRFTEANINDASYVFTHNQNGKVYIDFSMLYRIKQNETEEWISYNIDVAMVVDENNKIERIVERRIEKL